MGRKTYDPRNGRHRPQTPRSDYWWLVELLAAQHRRRTNPQTPGHDQSRQQEAKPQ
jgi:hypothetical protein